MNGGKIRDIFSTFLKLGLTSFGGPIAHIGYFRKELVERRQWVTESQYAQLLAISQFLPGPASSQLGFAIGLIRAGAAGAIAAFIAFTLPSALLLLLFAYLVPNLVDPIGQTIIHGLKIVAFAVVADAVFTMFRNLCPDTKRRAIAMFATLLLLLTSSAWFQILVVLFGAALGLMLCRQEHAVTEAQITVPIARQTALLLFALFLLLLIALPWLATATGELASIANAFYRSGALVFGGGHVVLPMLEQSVVEPGWVSAEHFLAGYGFSQAIPGPMFAFSAYLGALIPSDHSSLLTATIALVAIFLPGLLLIAAALPAWQVISHQPLALNAIAGVNAAIVGILCAALYDPLFTSAILSTTDMAIATAAFGMLTLWRLSPLWVVAWGVAATVISGIL
ncbi:chromate efflux transporter [Ectothiorhodospiraceae bacterium BW-2]|nr:chromate efflux transporter [Ectothiorhodospiraceae bacterium BW-2]